MNINLLEDNPDWKWYILFGCVSLVITGVLWLFSKWIPVRTLIRIALDYITAGTDIHILETDTGQYDKRMGILARKKREDKFRFFNMKPESYVILRMFGNSLEVKPL